MLINQFVDKYFMVSYSIARVCNGIIAVLKPISIGFVMAYLLKPIVNFYEKRLFKIKFIKKYSRIVSVYASIITAILFIVILISFFVSSVTKQVRIADFSDIELYIDNIMESINSLYNLIIEKVGTIEAINDASKSLASYITDLASSIVNWVQDLLNDILGSLGNVSSYFTTVMFSFIIGTYFLSDSELIIKFFDRIRKVIFSEKVDRKISELLIDLDTAFSGYIRGQLLDVLFMMFAISITLLITGCKCAEMIGIIAGIGNIIPYFGPTLAYGLTIIVCLLNTDFKVMIISVIALFIIQFLDGNIIGPKLLSRSIEIHPLLVIIFLIIGSKIGGFLGMLLAVPTGGFIKIIFMKWIEKKEQLKEEVEK